MRRNIIKRIAYSALATVMVAQIASVPAMADGDDATADSAQDEVVAADSSIEQVSTERLTTNYSLVSAEYKSKVYSGSDVVINIEDSISSDTSSKLTSDNYDYTNKVANVTVGDTIKLTAYVPETAQYLIGFDYLSYDNSILPIEMSFMVDGEFPFYEARNINFETTWITTGEASYDRYGNEIVTLPEKKIQWEYKELSDASYRYSAPLLVELTEGTHEFEMTVSEGSYLIGNLTLTAPTEIPEYTGSETASGDNLITIETEYFTERNDSSIHATCEYDSAVSKLSSTTTILNTVDQDSFDTAGQKITYEFYVESAGYYNFALNYRQGDKNGFPVFINYEIDGVVPNSEFYNYPMTHTTKYVTSTLTDDDGNKLSVYLEEGLHTISMTISNDYLRYALEAVDRIMSEINDLSLEVTKIAGTNKDKYRDLRLTRYIPDVQETLYGWVDELNELVEKACVYVGTTNPKDVAAFGYLLIAAKQLKTLGDEPNELIYRVAELATSVNSVNTQIANFVDIISANSIAIDRIYVYQEGASLPKKLNFLQTSWMSIQRFFNSFFGESYSTSNINEDHIQVWVNRPRQYVEIIQKMIDDEFTPATGIEVDLSIMTDANKLVLANASGDTPDIATGINYSIPFELGIRGALVDLTKFDNYKEVFGRYSDGLLVPSVIGDGFYSLPETMNFYVMFYRTDTLDKLGLEPPNTIDELIAILPDLQMRGLNVFYPTAAMTAMRNFHGTTPLIFQNGGSLYGDTALDITIDSEESVEGFTQLTELFTLYNLPVDVPNFYQHFRNGDLCIGIADFNSYNLILNAAPEIANSWSIALIPGVEDEETGEILRYISGGAESSVMFASTEEREQKAWEFLDWWSSAEVQAEFGQMLQIMYGDEYIWPTANLEAFANLPFPTKDKEIIIEQASYILEAPRLLGSYMMEREVSNAFNDIVVNGENLRSRMDEIVKVVTRETLRKLEEFGYVDSEGNVIKEYETPNVEKVREILNR